MSGNVQLTFNRFINLVRRVDSECYQLHKHLNPSLYLSPFLFYSFCLFFCNHNFSSISFAYCPTISIFLYLCLPSLPLPLFLPLYLVLPLRFSLCLSFFSLFFSFPFSLPPPSLSQHLTQELYIYSPEPTRCYLTSGSGKTSTWKRNIKAAQRSSDRCIKGTRALVSRRCYRRFLLHARTG